MYAEVEQTFCYIESGDSTPFLQLLCRKNELVLAGPIVGKVEAPLQALLEVICIQYGQLAHPGQAVTAHGKKVGIGLNHYGHISVESGQTTNRVGPVIFKMISVGPLHDIGYGQERQEGVGDQHRSRAGSPSPMGCGKGFMEIEMHHVETHVSGAYLPHDGIEIGAIVVQKTAGAMDCFGNLQDVLFEQPKGVGVGQHDTGQGFIEMILHAVKGDQAPAVGADLHHLKTRQVGGGRVCAVGRVRNQHLGSTSLSPLLKVGLEELHPRELPLSSGEGLQGTPGHTCDLAQPNEQLVHQGQDSLSAFFRLQGMKTNKGFKGGHLFVDLGVVLHSAGAQGIEAQIHTVVSAA